MSQFEPKNLAAQLEHRGRGNPPGAHPASAISNSFPGLETDFRNLFRRLFDGIVLHEAIDRVLSVTDGSVAAQAGVTPRHFLISVNGIPLRGPGVPPSGDTIERSNCVAEILHLPGPTVRCRFERMGGQQRVEVDLAPVPIFDGIALNEQAIEPGTLTQSLCSPWQNDYRECACFYWAANRPDYVNVEINGEDSAGHNWMQRDRAAATPKEYVGEDDDPRLLTYDDLFVNWERSLRFEIGGKDAD
jgi:hypothetical protein